MTRSPLRSGRACLPLVAIALLAGLPFVLVWPREFTNWDDQIFVSHNGAVQYPTLTNLGFLLTDVTAGNWIPLTMLTYTLDWQLSDGSAWGFATTNALLYAACCVLLVHCLQVCGASRETALLTALLFAVHPLHVEPVAWISGRKDVLSLLLLIAALTCYAQWLNEGFRRRYWCSLLLLAAAGLSKPIAMSAGVAMWLFAVLVRRGGLRQTTRTLAPHLLVCLSILVIAVSAQRTDAALRGPADPRWGAWDVAGCKVGIDLLRSFVPIPYSPFYPGNLLDEVPRFIRVAVTLAMLGVSLGLLPAFRRSGRIRRIAFGWFAALSFLIPVSGIVPLGWTSIADRYLLIPSIGSCLVIALCLQRLRFRSVRPVIGIAVLGSAVLLNIRAYDWSNSVVLWQATLQRYPQSPLPWKNLTSAYYQRGQTVRAAETALTSLQRVPEEESLIHNAVEILLEQNRLAEAEDILGRTPRRELQATERDVLAAKLALRRQQPAAALQLLERVHDRQTDSDEFWLVLSYAWQQSGELPRAIAAAERAVSLAPEDAALHQRVIELYVQGRDLSGALSAAHEATKAVPHSREAWKRRVELLEQTGRRNAANEVRSESARFVRPPLEGASAQWWEGQTSGV